MTNPDEKTNVINDADLDAVAGGLTIEEMYEQVKEELDSGVKGRFSTMQTMQSPRRTASTGFPRSRCAIRSSSTPKPKQK